MAPRPLPPISQSPLYLKTPWILRDAGESRIPKGGQKESEKVIWLACLIMNFSICDDDENTLRHQGYPRDMRLSAVTWQTRGWRHPFPRHLVAFRSPHWTTLLWWTSFRVPRTRANGGGDETADAPFFLHADRRCETISRLSEFMKVWCSQGCCRWRRCWPRRSPRCQSPGRPECSPRLSTPPPFSICECEVIIIIGWNAFAE